MSDETFDTTMMLWSEKAISDITNTSLLSVEDMEKIKRCADVSSHAFHPL